jgi:hypothetical protein
MEPQMNLTPRAERVWKRMVQMFGDKLTGMYPRGMPASMAQVIDRVNDNAVISGLAVLAKLKQPPGIAEFEQAMGSVPAPPTKPTRTALMVGYIVDTRPLTAKQRAMPWTWVQVGGLIHSVRVPPDGDANGFTVEMHELDDLTEDEAEHHLRRKPVERKVENNRAAESRLLLTGCAESKKMPVMAWQRGWK